ncbi:MAG: molybdopterin converting factor [Chloroflexi bacterium HGW-Chloroflexi-3]|nr:MAG: molybdopterin converting factor [Chloroflexi bacterium HGW-Chloroflexi-3]
MNNNNQSNNEPIHLKILFFAKLKELVGTSEIQIDIEKGATIQDLKNRLIIEYPQLKDFLPVMLISINQNFAFDSEVILENAELACFPPVSGGQMDNNVIIEVSTTEFDFNSLIFQSIQNTTGAVVMFTGVIRGETNNSDHPLTSGLEYEAYIPMAEAKMAQVAEEIHDKWPTVQKIVIIQRIGYMDAGTPTVVVLCSAAHRHTGVFDAAKYGIDRIKEIVPIWKKEISPDGETWIEGDYIPGKGD